MREGGINEGSGVGLLKALHVLGLQAVTKDSLATVDTIREVVAENANRDVMQSGTTSKSARHDSVMTDASKTPGVVILNPGQRLYSHELNDCMTQVTWYARRKPSSAIDDPYHIDVSTQDQSR